VFLFASVAEPFEIISAKKDFFSGRGLDLMRVRGQPIMSSHTLFQVNRPQVISQTIDGEVVVINLQTGNYYSLTGAAAVIWDALERGEAASQITGTLSAHFTDCDAGLKGIVDVFLDELRDESLIVPAENIGPVANGVLNGAQIKREKFVRAALKKFTDMRELLLLDPIHEVGETGWPQARPPTSSGHASQ
jgi:Coenzyme PQQ synthesis protein D (PqqD)